MVHRYAGRELEWLYFSLRDNLHIECYYERALDFDEVQIRLDDLKYYIDKIEEKDNSSKTPLKLIHTLHRSRSSKSYTVR